MRGPAPFEVRFRAVNPMVDFFAHFADRWHAALPAGFPDATRCCNCSLLGGRRLVHRFHRILGQTDHGSAVLRVVGYRYDGVLPPYRVYNCAALCHDRVTRQSTVHATV